MRTILCCAACVLFAGCSTVSSVGDAWTWDATRPPPKVAVSVPELAALTNRVAELQIQRNDIRNRISAEPDIWARQRLYADLHGVGMQLSPLERQLSGIPSSR